MVDRTSKRSPSFLLCGWPRAVPAALLCVLVATAAPVLAAPQDPPATATSPTAPAPAAASEVDELRRALEALRAEIAAMKAERAAERAADEAATAAQAAPPPALPATSDPDRLAEVERKLDVLAGELERLALGEVAARADRSDHGLGPAASKIYRTGEGLSIGGYGEMVYSDPDKARDDGGPSGAAAELDFLRGIVYFGYKFDDRWLFNSEIEFEHASTGADGEASVEFAYLDYLWRPEASFRAGLLLVPMGFVNELHEPTVFLGAQRPDTERVILPTTWRENGFGLFGDAGPVSYRAYVVNGLEGEGFSAGGLRGGRQKGSKAVAEDFAFVGRVDVAPVPGLLFGGSVYAGDSGQALADPAGRPIEVGTTIVEGHAEWRWRGLELRGLYARAELDDVARLNTALGLTGARSVGEELTGWYLQAGYDVLSRFPTARQLIPYARYEALDTQAKVPAGFLSDPARRGESFTLGLAFQPIDQVIVKADWQDYDNDAGTAVDRFNVALGYIF